MSEQCDKTETWDLAGGGKGPPIQCSYVAGHTGDCLFSVHDESDAIRWKLASDRRDQLQAEADALATKITALREAWLDIPWCGEVEKGDGHWIQTLVNAATAIVDPDGKLRADPDAQRRGKIAEYRRRYERAKEQMSAGEKFGLSAEVEKWRVIRDEAAAASRDEFGIYLDAPEPK